MDVKIVSKKGNAETSNRLVTRVKGYTKSLAIYKEPYTKDQVLLMIDNNMWSIFPQQDNPFVYLRPTIVRTGFQCGRSPGGLQYRLQGRIYGRGYAGTNKLLKLSLKAMTKVQPMAVSDYG